VVFKRKIVYYDEIKNEIEYTGAAVEDEDAVERNREILLECIKTLGLV
jgi:hypothetical protein